MLELTHLILCPVIPYVPSGLKFVQINSISFKILAILQIHILDDTGIDIPGGVP